MKLYDAEITLNAINPAKKDTQWADRPNVQRSAACNADEPAY